MVGLIFAMITVNWMKWKGTFFLHTKLKCVACVVFCDTLYDTLVCDTGSTERHILSLGLATHFLRHMRHILRAWFEPSFWRFWLFNASGGGLLLLLDSFGISNIPISSSHSPKTRRRHLESRRLESTWSRSNRFEAVRSRSIEVNLVSNDDWSRRILEKYISKNLQVLRVRLSHIRSYTRKAKRWVSAERIGYNTIRNASHWTVAHFRVRVCDTIASNRYSFSVHNDDNKHHDQHNDQHNDKWVFYLRWHFAVVILAILCSSVIPCESSHYLQKYLQIGRNLLSFMCWSLW